MRLAHEIWGEGSLSLVAVHGFTGSHAAWAHLQPRWAPHCRVLAVDLPGHGESALNSGTTFASSVASLLELVEASGFGGANLLGYSLGARVALAAATQAPERFSRLILESGSPGLTRRKARLRRRREDEALARSIESGGLQEFVRRWEALPLFQSLSALPETLREGLRARRLAGSVEGLAGSLRVLGVGSQRNLWPLLPALRLPTLLLTGARDEKFTEIAKRMAAELPSAWRKTFPGVGHAPHLEVPEEYAAEVLEFLRTPWEAESRHWDFDAQHAEGLNP